MSLRLHSLQQGRRQLQTPGRAPLGEAGRGITPLRRHEAENNEIDITFFIACYNEEDGIIPTLETIIAAMNEAGRRYDMIVVDDSSRDRSPDLVKEFQRRHADVPLKLIENRRNLGLGHNFFAASHFGRGRYYKLVCGDNVTPKETLLQLCQHLGKADIIVPYHPVIEGRTFFRDLLSWVYTRLVNAISGHKLHYYNGCGILQRTDVMRWQSDSKGFGFQADLLTGLLDEGATVLEIAVPGLERAKGRSSALRFRNWMSVGHSLVKILLRRLRRAFFS